MSSHFRLAERVLANVDTDVHAQLVNSRFAYVSVSRASHEAHIYTNDAASLAENLSHDVTKASAVDFSKSHDSPLQPGFEQNQALVSHKRSSPFGPPGNGREAWVPMGSKARPPSFLFSHAGPPLYSPWIAK